MFLMPMVMPPLPPPQAQILILSGADIWGANQKKSVLLRGQELAIQGGRVIRLAPTGSLSKQYPQAKVVHLSGGTILPGLFESHGHVSGLGASLEELQLNGMTDKAMVLNKIKEWSEKNTESWLIGRGWDQNLWSEKRFPTAKDLDELEIPNPILLERVDGHAIWVNSKALSLASIDASTEDPLGGRIDREINGNPSGILIDNATGLVAKALPPPSPSFLVRRILLGLNYLSNFGFTSVCDMGVTKDELNVYRRLDQENKLPIKVFAYLVNDDVLINDELTRSMMPLDTHFKIQGVKIYMDGALGSRGARLLEPYADDPLNRGLWITHPNIAVSAIERVLRAGYQPAIHAIGDAANHETIKILSLFGPFKGSSLRPRIEHAQILAPKDIKQMGELNIIASIQPVHCTSDHSWTPGRLGQSRLHEAFPWRNLLSNNVSLVLGSDTPVEHPNPFITLAAAETRQDEHHEPALGFLPDQVMTRTEAIDAYTRQAAMALGEATMGIIKTGAVADMIWIPDNILQVKPDALRKIKASRIWISGQERPVR